MHKQDMILPGSWIGILGGGQLGKMTAMAAARLGYKTIVWTPPGDVPATDVATHSILKPYDDPEAFLEFIKFANVCTIEFENIPVELLKAIKGYIPVRPSPDVLEVTQDRWFEKKLFSRLGISAVPAYVIKEMEDVDPELYDSFQFPAILKTLRLGYDGKGQVEVESPDAVATAWRELKMVPCILEERLNFICEGSVIVSRSPSGKMETYPVFENLHRDGILLVTKFPMQSAISHEAHYKAHDMARTIAEDLKLEGLLAVEVFFALGNEVYANELAPRPHNSGHGTIEACSVSQFEQLVRAICNLPLGDPRPHSQFTMLNLIGEEINRWPGYLERTRTSLHIYGKKEVKSGRKMGHTTQLSSLPR